MVASVVRGQCATRGVGPVHGTTNCWVEHQSQRSPSPKMVPYRCIDIVKENCLLSNILLRASERSSTLMPGVRLQSPIRDLIPIESLPGPSQDKGKGRAIEVMDEGKSERACLVSVIVSEYEGAFHGGSSAFVYDWIDNAHGDSNLEGPQDSIEDWMTAQSYQDATEEPIE